MDEAERQQQDPGELEKALKDSSGSIEKAKEDFIAAGTTQFGSGWAWLTLKDGKLSAAKTQNGENPLRARRQANSRHRRLGAFLCMDYRNRRPDYLKAWVDHLINWEYVAELFGPE